MSHDDDNADEDPPSPQEIAEVIFEHLHQLGPLPDLSPTVFRALRQCSLGPRPVNLAFLGFTEPFMCDPVDQVRYFLRHDEIGSPGFWGLLRSLVRYGFLTDDVAPKMGLALLALSATEGRPLRWWGMMAFAAGPIVGFAVSRQVTRSFALGSDPGAEIACGAVLGVDRVWRRLPQAITDVLVAHAEALPENAGPDML